MDETTNLKGKDLLARLTSDPNSGITSESGMTQAQVAKLVNDIDAEYGRQIATHTKTIDNQKGRITTLEGEYGTVNKWRREQEAAKLEASTGVKASHILEFGGDKIEDMEKYAKKTATELGIKPKTPPEGDKSNETNSQDKGDGFKLDSNQTTGTTGKDTSKMSPDELISHGLKQDREKSKK